ncbi:hypothetical protein MRB53_005274 [Persea americana]|uniref:Uncharacterized protein n=1 Tax=Persea americana TaxID=3435 RepID=A0ACC2MCJ3_PERAE|nr:hypothetical protein MRB53_005274 [Persea americana]
MAQKCAPEKCSSNSDMTWLSGVRTPGDGGDVNRSCEHGRVEGSEGPGPTTSRAEIIRIDQTRRRLYRPFFRFYCRMSCIYACKARNFQ